MACVACYGSNGLYASLCCHVWCASQAYIIIPAGCCYLCQETHPVRGDGAQSLQSLTVEQRKHWQLSTLPTLLLLAVMQNPLQCLHTKPLTAFENRCGICWIRVQCGMIPGECSCLQAIRPKPTHNLASAVASTDTHTNCTHTHILEHALSSTCTCTSDPCSGCPFD